jgi:hypothetical protein
VRYKKGAEEAARDDAERVLKIMNWGLILMCETMERGPVMMPRSRRTRECSRAPPRRASRWQTGAENDAKGAGHDTKAAERAKNYAKRGS